MKYNFSESRLHYFARNLLNLIPVIVRSRAEKGRYRVCAIPNDLIGRSFAASGAYEAAGIAAVEWFCHSHAILKPESTTFVDVGANIGTYTLPLSFKFRSVIAYEPHPVTFKILSLNIEINEIENVQAVNCGLSDKNGRSLLYEPSHENIGAASVEHPNGGAAYPISLLHASEAIRELQNSPVSFIKIDVEGHECKVIEGLSDLIMEQHPVIAFEANDLSKNQGLMQALRGIGYSKFIALDTKLRLGNPWLRALILLIFGVKYRLRQVEDISKREYSLVFALPK